MTPFDFQPRLVVNAHQAQRVAERQVQHMPLERVAVRSFWTVTASAFVLLAVCAVFAIVRL